MRPRTLRSLAIGLPAALLLTGGVAAADTASTPSSFTGCLNKATGALYAVTLNATTAPTCLRGDTVVKWNQKGDPGPAGPPGAAGVAGATGPAGATGQIGATGAKGDPGPAGAVGADGPAGPKGDTGSAGAAGDPGPTGPQGLPGAPGAKGDTGAVG